MKPVHTHNKRSAAVANLENPAFQSPPPSLSKEMHRPDGHGVGLASGWQRRCKTRHSLRELGDQVTVCFGAHFVVVGNRNGGDHVVRDGESQLHTRGMTISRSVEMVRPPRDSSQTHRCGTTVRCDPLEQAADDLNGQRLHRTTGWYQNNPTAWVIRAVVALAFTVRCSISGR